MTTAAASGHPTAGGAPLRLVLARHGQTPSNVDHVLDTRLPGPGLTELGRAQAAALGRDLADGVEGPVSAVYHSRARRAGETAAEIGRALALEPQPVEGVHEVQAGALEGHNDDAAVDEFRGVLDAWLLGDLDKAQPGGESGHDLLTRFHRGLADVTARHPDGGTLVLVSHGAALRLALTDLLPGDDVPPPEENHLANCARVVLDRSDAGDAWRLVAWRPGVPGGLPSSHDATE